MRVAAAVSAKSARVTYHKVRLSFKSAELAVDMPQEPPTVVLADDVVALEGTHTSASLPACSHELHSSEDSPLVGEVFKGGDDFSPVFSGDGWLAHAPLGDALCEVRLSAIRRRTSRSSTPSFRGDELTHAFNICTVADGFVTTYETKAIALLIVNTTVS